MITLHFDNDNDNDNDNNNNNKMTIQCPNKVLTGFQFKILTSYM